MQISTGDGGASVTQATGTDGFAGSQVFTVFWHSPGSPHVTYMSSATPLQSSSRPLQASSVGCQEPSAISQKPPPLHCS